MRFRDDYTHDIRKHLVSGGILLRGDPAASLCGNCPGLCHRGGLYGRASRGVGLPRWICVALDRVRIVSHQRLSTIHGHNV